MDGAGPALRAIGRMPFGDTAACQPALRRTKRRAGPWSRQRPCGHRSSGGEVRACEGGSWSWNAEWLAETVVSGPGSVSSKLWAVAGANKSRGLPKSRQRPGVRCCCTALWRARPAAGSLSFHRARSRKRRSTTAVQNLAEIRGDCLTVDHQRHHSTRLCKPPGCWLWLESKRRSSRRQTAQPPQQFR